MPIDSRYDGYKPPKNLSLRLAVEWNDLDAQAQSLLQLAVDEISELKRENETLKNRNAKQERLNRSAGIFGFFCWLFSMRPHALH